MCEARVLYYTCQVADISRRHWLKTAGGVVAGAAVGAVAHGYGWERHALRLVAVDIPVAGLKPEFNGFRIGFISDLHHSALVPLEDVEAAASLVAAEAPDLVVLGGDYVSYADRAYMEPVSRVLGQLRARDGVVAIIGNHDDERYMPHALERHGVRVLADERTKVVRGSAALEVVGLKFWTRQLEMLRRLVDGAVDPVVLLAHDPRRVVEADALGIQTVLAGHTHGGQIVLPGLGALAARKFPVAKGRLTRNATELYVSAGVGTVLVPLRLNCPPEVTVATLRPSPSARGA